MDKRIEKVIFKGLILVINKVCIGYMCKLNLIYCCFIIYLYLNLLMVDDRCWGLFL